MELKFRFQFLLTFTILGLICPPPSLNVKFPPRVALQELSGTHIQLFGDDVALIKINLYESFYNILNFSPSS